MPRKPFTFLAVCLAFGVSATAQAWITGYYVDTTLNMTDIPWSKMTHVIHFKTYPTGSSGNIAGIPGGNADEFTATAHVAGVKAILSVADNNSNPSAFSAALANNFNNFVHNVVHFVEAHHYDGVDLDWETSSYGAGTTDGANYIRFIKALRAALPGKVISIAVYWNNGLENVTGSAHSELSQVNIMCYDMDQWLSHTYHNDALYRPAGDTTNTSCQAEAAQFARHVPAAKIGLGIPLYGRIWSGCSNSSCSDGLHQPMQKWSGTPSQTTIYYKDLLNSPYWSSRVWDSARGATYISINDSGAGNDKFITYTSEHQIREIVKMGKSAGYGGYMLFEVEYDFVSSASGDARHPLVNATHKAVTQ